MRRQFLVCSIAVVIVLCATTQVLTGGTADSYSSDGSPVPPIPPVLNPCSRPAAGAIVQNPPALYSSGGVLSVGFTYQSTNDADGRTLFCFMTSNGLENPTLHVYPGDRLILNLTNNTPIAPIETQINPPNCTVTGDVTGSSLNLHLHGTDTSPTCQQDQIIHTVINSGEAYQYVFQIPPNEPPGLYWYHTHIHGLVEAALQGGASGAIVVEGLQNFQPAVAGLPERIMMIRDQNVAGNPPPGGDVPSWDVTLNNIPISYPTETPAVIQMRPGQQQFWRVSNSSADTLIDLQVQYDGVPQNLQIVALDGVPTGSQYGSQRGQIVNTTDIYLPTAERAEFIVTAPSWSVKSASLVTLNVNTGPDGDNDPPRTLATIETSSDCSIAGNDVTMPATIGPTWPQRYANLDSAEVDAYRTLYFSEGNHQFFITVDGATPALFDPNAPPAIVTTAGSVEDWTIENRTQEVHPFHIHQVHFLVLEQNNFEVNGTPPDAIIQGQFLDTIAVPFWDGNPDHPYPNVKVRMDFRGAIAGDFVYHCHIASHEDKGMMAIIRVEPSYADAAIERTRLNLAWLGETLGFVRGPDPLATEQFYAWCRARNSELRSRRTARIDGQLDSRLLARQESR